MSERSRILVAVDYSEWGARALDEAARLAVERSGELHVLTVAPEASALAETRPPSEDLASAHHVFEDEALNNLQRYVTERTDQLALTPDLHTHVRFGEPAPAIAALARELDAGLVVVGTHGRGPLERLLLGSVARSVLERVTAPVLVVR